MQGFGYLGGLLVLLSFLTLASTPITRAFASTEPANDARVCDEAIRTAAEEFGVPRDVLKAVARTESGITVGGLFVPWPWTINIEGRGLRFSSKSKAVEYFRHSYSNGARNIDLGCFQVNHRWHGDQFSSVADMLNPRTNARYAARFLKQLHREFGNWTMAVGAFHSRTAKFSEKYLARYTPILRNLTGEETEGAPAQRTVKRQNRFPLLHGTSKSRSNGSLFPLAEGLGKSLLTRSGARG
ncbi:MAG: lytic transglycosylase domain-containing protein [Pseudomonadota bacterium]